MRTAPRLVRADFGERTLAPDTLRWLRALEDARIPYCLLRRYTEPLGGDDLDFVVPRDALPARVAAVLRHAAEERGGLLVQAVEHDGAWSFVVADRDQTAGGAWRFLRLDAWPAPDVGPFRFHRGEDLLASRRREADTFVPGTATEFGCLLTRRITKGDVRPRDAERLARLHAADPVGCEQEIRRFWPAPTARALIAAARAHAWTAIARRTQTWRTELRRKALRTDPLGILRRRLGREWTRARHLLRPANGLHVVFLGPDGAGKSTIIDAVRRALEPVFSAVSCRAGAPPSLRQLRDGTYRLRAIAGARQPEGRPHAATIHSTGVSVLKAAYWLAYYVLGHPLTVRPALARGQLILHHRYVLDALVDPARYRYGGPPALLRLVWHATPEPDAVILLDAPAETIRRRKSELPRGEIERQLAAYRSLVARLPNGHGVDATASEARTAEAVVELLLRKLAQRTEARFA